MTDYNDKETNYYLNRATLLKASGITFCVGHFVESKPHMPGGDDGIEGPGCFWILGHKESYSHLRIKRIMKQKTHTDSAHEIPHWVPVTDSGDLSLDVVQESFKKMLDEYFEAEKKDFNRTPTVGDYNMVQIASLLTTEDESPKFWWSDK
jgi:hypothetical protein